MKTIFAVTGDYNIRTSKFFIDKNDAKIYLKTIANDRKNRFGVTVVVNEDEKFSFTLGWEEHQVTFIVVEISIE